jgi:hypothetical protein
MIKWGLFLLINGLACAKKLTFLWGGQMWKVWDNESLWQTPYIA